MIRLTFILPMLTSVLTCGNDETLSGYGAADISWVLQELDGTPFGARATLFFPEEGKLSGEGPCNTYHGTQTAPYPWFKAENVAVTRRACPELEAESLFFSTLAEMSLAEVAGNTLLLSNDEGRVMLFEAEN